MNMITMIDIHKKFGHLEVIKGINLSLDKGNIVSIIGPSGSGKSTLLRTINHLEKIDKGIIKIEDVETAYITDKKTKIIPQKIVKQSIKKIGMVFQNFNLFPHKTALENVIEAPIIVNKVKKKDAIEMANDLLNKVGIFDKRDTYPSKLSGGQKQRVAIARALGMNPDIMLFDEPTSALDPELIGEVISVIKNLAKEKMSMLIVTHEMGLAKEISDNVIFMDNGVFVESGSPSNIFNFPNHPRLQTFINSIR